MGKRIVSTSKFNLEGHYDSSTSGIFIFMILFITSKMEKLKYKYYNVIAVYMQS